MNSAQNTTHSARNATLKGTKVRVELHGGEVVERVVWEVDSEEGVVYLCSAKVFADLEKGITHTNPIGFPKESVKWT